jgi:O-antigen ligase
MILDQPVVGFGYGNFERFDEGYKQRVGDIPLILGGSAHNTYLNMLAELGIPATLLYLSPPLVLLALSYRLWRRHRYSKVVDWRFVLILWLAVLDQFVVNNFLEIIHSSFWATSLWWLTLGLLATQLESLRRVEAVWATPVASGR